MTLRERYEALNACRSVGIDDWICRAQFSYPDHPDNTPDIAPDGGVLTVRLALILAERWPRRLEPLSDSSDGRHSADLPSQFRGRPSGTAGGYVHWRCRGDLNAAHGGRRYYRRPK